MIIIGDVHGRTDEYYKIIQSTKENTIQLGDFGFYKHHTWFLENVDFKKHKVSFGNHDDYTFLDKPHSLGDYSMQMEKDQVLMTVRGAYSIDQNRRAPYIDYWPNEEFNQKEAKKAFTRYKAFKPNIMITHDCPHSVREHMFDITDKSITTDLLEEMLQFHSPDVWIFGHHHQSRDEVIGKTQFICLNELETYKI